MADPIFDKQQFLNIQSEIKEFRNSKDNSRMELRTIGEKIKKLKQQLLQAQRTGNKKAEQSIQKQLEALQKKQIGAEAKNRELLKNEISILKSFDLFSDPRTAIKLLDDSYPILMFPVRLETRFKIVQGQHQLWVRVFPDECSINSFDSVLSESEKIKIRSYWISRWKTGAATTDALKSFVRNKDIGTWKMLMGSFNAGRAYWLTQNYQPVNAAEIPVRSNESTIHLIIPTEVLPAAAQVNPIKDYWKAAFLAKGDATKLGNAFSAFRTATGETEEGALALLEKYKPQDFEKEPVPEGTFTTEVFFIQFPSSETDNTKQSAWAQAARVTTLPDRFVLLGFQKNNPTPVVNQLGNFVPDPLFVGPDTKDDIEKVLIEEFGPEIETMADEEKAVKYIEYLSKRSETKWLFDFDEAIKMGLGFKVNLTQQAYQQGFEKLFVLGVKISSDKNESKTALENLIKDHHFGDSGFSLIPQGTPTNNTEDQSSGYTDQEDSDEAYGRYFENTESDFAGNPNQQRDGAWMAEILGISSNTSSLNLVQNYFHKDQVQARAMNTALWNATLGYFLESMITPVTTEADREKLRWFLIEFVSGRGKIPAIRIKNQPYGILPISKSSANPWLTQPESLFRRFYREEAPFLANLLSVFQKVRSDWEKLTSEVAYVGKGGDAHKNLLQAVGLHAGSVQFEKRTAQSFSHIINLLTSQGILGDEIDNLDQEYKGKGLQLLQKLGYTHDAAANPSIPILEKYFLGKPYKVERPLVDDLPLSEEKIIRPYTTDDKNYIEWLIANAQNNHSNIKDQKGFKDNKIPQAILYDMLRHALDLEFGNTGLRILRNAEILSIQNVREIQIDSPFIGIQSNITEVESKWDVLYRKEPVATKNDLIIADHISQQLKNKIFVNENKHLHEIKDALETLKDASTASLERCLTEHLDLCSYRLDAWLSGFQNLQLKFMRFAGVNSTTGAINTKQFREGIYLGAFGMLENLKPDNKTFTNVNLDPQLKAIFDPANQNDITSDNTNAGYVHAPSINHGLTAAVLRNAYISAASKEDAEIYKINLSSERVRLAMSIVEGMQQGQGLGELLGYQLERGLHDNNTEEMNSFIYELRKVFPLKANKLKLTELKKGKIGTTPAAIQRIKEEEEEMNDAKAITKVQANNVINGLALIEQINKSKVKTYPFGIPIGEGAGHLMQATLGQAGVINKEVERILNIRDAVADLAIAESVHQVVQGNYDRAAGSLDAFSKGHYPQFPEVVSSPSSGTVLTHRFAIHLPGGISPATGTTPRSKAQASINTWLKDIFPASLADIACKVSYTVPNYLNDTVNPASDLTITLADLGLEPIDLLFLLDSESDKNLTALDDYILKYFHTQTGPKRPDMKIEINYTATVTGKISFFEISALINQLKPLLISSRALQPNDIALPNESKKSDNVSSIIDPARISQPDFNTLKTGFVNVLSAFIDDEDSEFTLAHTNQIIDQIDALGAIFIQELSKISLFGNKQSGFGHFIDRRAGIFSEVYKKVGIYINTWKDKLLKFNNIINIQVPASPDEESKINLLQEAERLISTEYTIGFADANDLRTDVLAKKPAFETKLGLLESFINGNFSTIKTLLTSAEALNTGLDDFDTEILNFDEDRKQVVILAEDIHKQASKLIDTLTTLKASVTELLNTANTSAVANDKLSALTDAGKLIFGEDFKLLPEFYIASEQASEIQNCLADQTQLLNYQITQKQTSFPVDDWLYGVARVREKLAAWESTVIFAEGFKQNLSLNLTPIQLPYLPSDSWLAAEYPGDYVINSDKLLYTAYIPSFNPSQPICGVLVDEWTEVIPAKKETTGLTFHYDRPNSEPPQALLLATPSSFTGEWKWDDLVGSLHETLAMAKLRALEPDIIDHTGYAQFLPATVAAFTAFPVSMALNYGIVKNAFSN